MPPPRRGPLDSAVLKVETTNFREGYLRKNGVPYSENAVIPSASSGCRSIPMAMPGWWSRLRSTIRVLPPATVLHEHEFQA